MRKIDKDIQEAVADEFCRKLDAGEIDLFSGVSWVIPEMERRQKERDSK